MRILVALGAALLLSGCDTKEWGQDLSEAYEIPTPVVWSIKSGHVLNLGDRSGKVIGTDKCNDGFGGAYDCWIFSLKDGHKKLIHLTNEEGSVFYEVWTTVDAGRGRIYLERPNGMRVSDSLPMAGFSKKVSDKN
ncbi:hypothetical protein [Neptuniibacter sp. QD37_11]|uniref:hypothetical protein n=1 Tax=Neptuniibacter sp. QD37_11 TaxID=3398209 RepID=UPI0039F451BB